jgi:hypothetical protein
MLPTKIYGRLSLRETTQISLKKQTIRFNQVKPRKSAISPQKSQPAKFETQHEKTAWNTPENHADRTSKADQSEKKQIKRRNHP